MVTLKLTGHLVSVPLAGGLWAWGKHQALVLGSWGPGDSARVGGTLAPVTLLGG